MTEAASVDLAIDVSLCCKAFGGIQGPSALSIKTQTRRLSQARRPAECDQPRGITTNGEAGQQQTA